MTLCLVPEVFDAVDVVLLVSKEFRMIDAKMLERGYIQYVVTAPAVRIDDAVRDDFLLDNGHQCRRSGMVPSPESSKFGQT